MTERKPVVLSGSKNYRRPYACSRCMSRFRSLRQFRWHTCKWNRPDPKARERYIP